MTIPIIELREIGKQFPGVRALDGVSFDVLPGEVHALLGENGAGKSTLIKCSTGVYQPDHGEILLDGRSIRISSPVEAQGLGVILISSDLPEVLAMSDRVLVMREGRQMGIFSRAEATQERIVPAAMGQ
jgi:ABC-type sugar transport system ATPase subunit